MHSDFSEWFRSANLPLQNDALQTRWAAVDGYAVDRDDVVSLVEVFFGYFDNKDKFLADFRKAFQDADSSFRMRDNNLELSVLAGATLVTVMQDSPRELGNFAAIALVACAAQNLRGTPCVPEIPEIAARHLARNSINRGQLGAEEKAGLETNLIEAKQLRRDLDVIGEESNMLWWVFGETSRETNKPWAECGVAQASLMAGKELADLTRIDPGPAAVGAILDRVVKNVRAKPTAQIAVKDAIADVPLGWRQKFLETDYIPALVNLSPVSHGIKLSVDLADDDAWTQSLASATKIQRGAKIAPSLLAYQFYLECLMGAVWSRLE